MKDLSNKSEVVKKDEKKKNLFMIILKKHKISLILILFLSFASVTFAWFIYNRTVGLGLPAHIKAWDVYLNTKETENYQFTISSLYPGMPNATDSVNIYNDGEIDADLEIYVKSVTLFGEVQTENVDYTVNVSQDGSTYNIEGYPFSIQFSLDNSTIVAGDHEELTFESVWNYDNTNEPGCTVTNGVNSCDLIDTDYGERSAEFEDSQADLPELEKQSSLIIESDLRFSQAA